LGKLDGKENFRGSVLYGDNIKTDLMTTWTENLEWIEVT